MRRSQAHGVVALALCGIAVAPFAAGCDLALGIDEVAPGDACTVAADCLADDGACLQATCEKSVCVYASAVDGTPCGDPGATCNGGACACPLENQCGEGGACVDRQIDAAHCGSCDSPCPPTHACNGGACACKPVNLCGAVCVETMGDPTACAACDGDPDGACDGVETCACPDCYPIALCTPGACIVDGACDGIEDSCTCDDCDGASVCAPTQCQADGVCAPYTEGCECPDCHTYPDCVDSVAACDDGIADGICALGTDSCACSDCFGHPTCSFCSDDAFCVAKEGCRCDDCLAEPACATCEDDGICWSTTEGCACADCAGLPPCP